VAVQEKAFSRPAVREFYQTGPVPSPETRLVTGRHQEQTARPAEAGEFGLQKSGPLD
jgi:hypothetical protein